MLNVYPEWEIVYECLKDDCGSAAEDTLSTGEEHLSVTTDPNGGYPTFTCPISQLRDVTPEGPDYACKIPSSSY